MKLIATVLSVITAVLAGCATAPRPDGSKISRLPETSSSIGMSAEERKRYDDVDKQVLREQQAVRDAERQAEMQAQAEARRRNLYPLYWGVHYGYGWPYWNSYGPSYWHAYQRYRRPGWDIDLHIDP